MNKRIKSNSIRIISGQWRGRKLEVLEAQGLRPTTDRVRETVFNWLMYELQGVRCLDLFAGTGALGLESLSRGADFVQFVELHPVVARSIRDSLTVLAVDSARAQVSASSFERFLITPPSVPYGLVFLDPPFGQSFLPIAIRQLSQPGWLSDNALIYIEQPSKQAGVEVPKQWQLYREGKAGQSRYQLYSLNDR